MKIILSNSDPTPIYGQIARQIRAQILSGDLAPGSPLPSIRGLAQTLQISVITTKRAYDELEKEGLLDTVGGKGTFVSAPSTEFLREKRMAAVEGHLRSALREAMNAGLDRNAVVNLLDLLLETEHA